MRIVEKVAGTKPLIIACVAFAFLALGCSKSNPLNPVGNCFGGNWAAEYANELQAWSDATAAYSEDPNAETCASYKNAAKAYLDALDDIYDCVPTASRKDLDADIKEAKADIDSEECQDD